MITLDTHVLIWSALQPDKLSAQARQYIHQANSTSEIIVPDICLWEIAMLIQKKRLVLQTTYINFIELLLEANAIKLAPITPQIADLSVTLGQEINGDPADRLICATSVIYGAPLLTADENLKASRLIKTIW